MDDDLEDVRKMTEFIQKQKLSLNQNNYQIEFQDFVTYREEPSFSIQDFEDELDQGDADSDNNVVVNPEISQLSLFTEDEQVTISCCADQTLKQLLVLNRTKNLMLIKLQRKIQKLLRHCEEEIQEKRELLDVIEAKSFNTQTYVWKLAAPYFKDKSFFPSPLNADALQKRAKSELSIYDLSPSPKWTPIEFERLISAVKCNYSINRQSDIVGKIHLLQSQIKDEDGDRIELDDKLSLLKQDLHRLQEDKELPPWNSNQYINWYKVSETFLRDKHTPFECQAVWQMLVHPDINKSEWTEDENQKLELIAKEHSLQNWEQIANELNTHRTSFTVCLHYFSKLCEKFKKNKFSADEDRFLLDVINTYKIGNFIPWNKIVCHFNNRSRHQLYHRYTYFLSKNDVKKGKFSEAEDILLMILVSKFGKNFKKCSEYMPLRSQMQLKSRYNSNLEKSIKKGTYTSEDDQIIYDYVQIHGDKSWGGLTNRLKRCRAQIRQRYKLISHFLEENPDADISAIPKRNRRRVDEISEDQYSFLKYMADQYKEADFIPTLEKIEECLQVESRAFNADKVNHGESIDTSAEDIKLKNIDTLLTEFFSKKISKTISESSLNDATENVDQVLKLFGANLQIPSNVECNKYFDSIDLEILDRISKKTDSISIMNKFIAPNINTLVTLRNLILKHKEYKSVRQENVERIAEISNDHLQHRNLFSKRFELLFDWSAVLSLEKPNELIMNKQSSNEINVTSDISILSSKRPAASYSCNVKRKKVTNTIINHSNEQSSAVECSPRLLQKKQNKMNAFEKVLINQSNIEEISHSADVDQSVDNLMVDEGDIQDLEKLNGFLESIKSELNKDMDFSDEDVKPPRNSVEALKKLRRNKSIKFKP